jgi:septal ring factor EnvC (AmiA/AmiB activator)
LTNQIENEKAELEKLVTEVAHLDSNLLTAENEFKQISVETKEAKSDLLKFERAQVELKETEKYLITKRKKLAKLLGEEKRKQLDDETWIVNFDADVTKVDVNLIAGAWTRRRRFK